MITSDLDTQVLIILLPGIIISSELLLMLPLARNSTHLAKLLKKILWMLRSPHISDHRKEQVTLHYAIKLLTQTLTMTAQLGMVFIPISLALWIATGSFQQMLVIGLDPATLFYISTSSLIYIFFRTRKKCPTIRK